MNPIRIEFCGEWYSVDAPNDFSIGRESDLVIDDNPYLHRHFLRLHPEFGMWWLGNIGTLLSATVTAANGRVQAWLAPGAKLPVVFEQMNVLFTAGSTTYDFTIHSADDYFNTSASIAATVGATTVEPIALTNGQRLLIVALAEHVLGRAAPGRSALPTSAQAAGRLGWSMTTFNRKLDNVCEKLDKIGVAGLRGGRGNLATNRRARLVEYAVAAHLVTAEDVALLDRTTRRVLAGDADG
jgi:hypothetical protein